MVSVVNKDYIAIFLELLSSQNTKNKKQPASQRDAGCFFSSLCFASQKI